MRYLARGHELRVLLGMLSSYLRRHGYENVAAEVDHFVDEHRRDLITAEEAYVGGRYGELGYSEEDSRRLRDVARRLSSWVRIRFEHLRRWREYAKSVARAARDVFSEDVEVYVVGGVAEGRTTVLSDIDILIVVDMFREIERDFIGRSWEGQSTCMGFHGTHQ